MTGENKKTELTDDDLNDAVGGVFDSPLWQVKKKPSSTSSIAEMDITPKVRNEAGSEILEQAKKEGSRSD